MAVGDTLELEATSADKNGLYYLTTCVSLIAFPYGYWQVHFLIKESKRTCSISTKTLPFLQTTACWISQVLISSVQPKILSWNIKASPVSMYSTNAMFSEDWEHSLVFTHGARGTQGVWNFENPHYRVKIQSCRRPIEWPIKTSAREALGQWRKN